MKICSLRLLLPGGACALSVKLMGSCVFPKQSLAKLQERFHLGQGIGRSEPDLRASPANSHLSLSRQTLDAGSQTSISGEVSHARRVCCPVRVPSAGLQ